MSILLPSLELLGSFKNHTYTNDKKCLCVLLLFYIAYMI